MPFDTSSALFGAVSGAHGQPYATLWAAPGDGYVYFHDTARHVHGAIPLDGREPYRAVIQGYVRGSEHYGAPTDASIRAYDWYVATGASRVSKGWPGGWQATTVRGGRRFPGIDDAVRYAAGLPTFELGAE